MSVQGHTGPAHQPGDEKKGRAHLKEALPSFLDLNIYMCNCAESNISLPDTQPPSKVPLIVVQARLTYLVAKLRLISSGGFSQNLL